MTLTQKIAAIVAALGLTAVVAIGAEVTCTRPGQVEIDADEVRVCFDDDSAYQTFRSSEILEFQQKLPLADEESFGYFDIRNDFLIMLAILKEERRRGHVNAGAFLNDGSLRQAILSL